MSITDPMGSGQKAGHKLVSAVGCGCRLVSAAITLATGLPIIPAVAALWLSASAIAVATKSELIRLQLPKTDPVNLPFGQANP
jgi:hypothetical protein